MPTAITIRRTRADGTRFFRTRSEGADAAAHATRRDATGNQDDHHDWPCVCSGNCLAAAGLPPCDAGARVIVYLACVVIVRFMPLSRCARSNAQ